MAGSWKNFEQGIGVSERNGSKSKIRWSSVKILGNAQQPECVEPDVERGRSLAKYRPIGAIEKIRQGSS